MRCLSVVPAEQARCGRSRDEHRCGRSLTPSDSDGRDCCESRCGCRAFSKLIAELCRASTPCAGFVDEPFNARTLEGRLGMLAPRALQRRPRARLSAGSRCAPVSATQSPVEVHERTCQAPEVMITPVGASSGVGPLTRARSRRVGYRVLVAGTVFVPIVATFVAIWRLWGDSIGVTELSLFVGFYVITGFGASIGFQD